MAAGPRLEIMIRTSSTNVTFAIRSIRLAILASLHLLVASLALLPSVRGQSRPYPARFAADFADGSRVKDAVMPSWPLLGASAPLGGKDLFCRSQSGSPDSGPDGGGGPRSAAGQCWRMAMW